MPFVSNISKLMEERKMTYEDLQFLSKLAPDTIARARSEKIAACKLATLEKLAKALNADVHELFEYIR